MLLGFAVGDQLRPIRGTDRRATQELHIADFNPNARAGEQAALGLEDALSSA
jgi:hypothetical protein